MAMLSFIDCVADTSIEKKVQTCLTTGSLKLSSKINLRNYQCQVEEEASSIFCVGRQDKELTSLAMKTFFFRWLGSLGFWVCS